MKSITRLGLMVALAAVLLTLFGTIILQLANLLEGRDVWAGFMGNFVSGSLTVVAAGIAFLLYFVQERQANVGRLIEWMATLAERYHADEEFKDVRVRLAMDRDRVRDRLYSETALNDAAVRGIQLPSFQRYVTSEHRQNTERGSQAYWEFQRRFTDYLYFFEQVLAHGELLRKNNTAEVGAALVDHFGWFLRSLYHCCEADDADEWEAQRFFVYYLAHNRYRRLSEVGLFLLQGEVNAVGEGGQSAAERSALESVRAERQAQLDTMAKEVCALLRKQRGEIAARCLVDVLGRWGRVLYAPAPTAR